MAKQVRAYERVYSDPSVISVSLVEDSTVENSSVEFKSVLL